MGSERGSVTIEWALTMPIVVVMLMAALPALLLMADKLVCISQTRDAAIVLARGGDPSLPDGAVVTRTSETVTVSVPRALTGCSATAVLEP